MSLNFCQNCQLPLPSSPKTPPNLPKEFCSYGCKLTHAHINKTSTSPLVRQISLAFILVLLAFALETLPKLGFAFDESILKNIQFASFFVATIIQIILGIPIYRQYFSSLKDPTIRTHQFCAAASLLAYSYSLYSFLTNTGAPFFNLASILLVIILAKSLIQAFIQKDASKGLENLFNLRVKTAQRKAGDKFISIPSDELKIDDIVKVAAGEKIPSDGVIISGTTSVDESMLTGEFKPILKGKNDPVIGATINRDSDIVVKITKEKPDTIIEKIIATLQSARSDNLPLRNKIVRFFNYLTPITFVLTLITFSVHYFYLGKPLDVVLPIAISTLVILCPGIFLTATFMALTICLSETMHKGIYINKSETLKNLSQLQILFFDKTGTFTKGQFTFSQLFIEAGTNQGEFLETLFSIEQNSDHPIGKAMETHPWYNEINKFPVKDFKNHSGLGVCGYTQPRGHAPYFAGVGNLRFLKRLQMHVSRDMKFKLEELEAIGETVILCGYQGQVKGLISFADILRSETRATLQDIQKLQIEPAILTGDTEEGIMHIIKSLVIKKVYSRCTPEEKAAKIQKAKEDYAMVGLVGDDLRDSTAFKLAQVTITIDTGTAFPKHSADAIIMGSNFHNIAWLLKKTSECFAAIRFNLIANLIYTLIAIPLAVLGFMPPVLAALSMTIFSLLQLFMVLGIREKGNVLGQDCPESRVLSLQP